MSIKTALFLGLILCAGCNNGPNNSCNNYVLDRLSVSTYHLTARPECFHNRKIEVKGVLGIKFGTVWLFPSKFDFLIENEPSAILLNLKLSPEDLKTLKDEQIGDAVHISGIFNISSGITVNAPPRSVALDEN